MTIYNNPTIKVKLRNSTTLSVPLPPFVNINAVNIAVTNSISIGTGLVNTQINSTSISLRSIRANNSFGTAGQVLTTNGTGVYWSTVTGGGGGGSFSNGIAYIWSDVQTFEANVFVSNAILSVGNTSVNVSINSTAFSGTANNANNLSGTSLATIQNQISGNASTAYTNAVADAATSAAGLYQTTAGLAANVVTLTANNSNRLGGELPAFYTNASNITTGTLAFARLPANAVFWSNTNTFTANQTFNANIILSGTTTNLITIGGNTINATTYTGTANNATNLGGVAASGYQTTAGLAANVAILTANNANNLGGVAAANYVNTSGNYVITGIHTLNANLFINTANQLLIGNGSVNAVANQTTLAVFNATTNTSITPGTITFGGGATVNNTIYTGTANNATNFNGQPASFYANATNLTTGLVNTAQLATSGTPSSTTFLRGDRQWVTVSGGTTNPAGNNTEIQFNDSSSFGANNRFTFDRASTLLTVGDGTNNTQINSTAVVLRTLIANSQVGSAGQVLTSAGAGANLYWQTLSGTFSPGTSYVWTAVQTYNANLFINTANQLLIGNVSVNAVANQTTFIIQNSVDYVSTNASTITFNGAGTINATAYTGTANNATNLGGTAAAGYQTTAGLAANVATLTANNANNLNGQPAAFYTNATNLATGTVPTARLATSGTPSSTTFLRGDQVWATPPGGGGGSPGGATADIQFNDAGAFAGNSNFTYDQAAVRLTVGNNSVNTQVNSTSIALRTLIANGGVGSAGQVLTSSGSGANIYWSTVSGGGGGGEVVTAVSINTSMAAPTTFYLASGTITLTLPTAVGNSGLKFQVKNAGTGQITIATTSSQTIDGNINMILTEKNSVIGLISDGANWSIF